jgi:hypothetical protein
MLSVAFGRIAITFVSQLENAGARVVFLKQKIARNMQQQICNLSRFQKLAKLDQLCKSAHGLFRY